MHIKPLTRLDLHIKTHICYVLHCFVLKHTAIMQLKQLNSNQIDLFSRVEKLLQSLEGLSSTANEKEVLKKRLLQSARQQIRKLCFQLNNNQATNSKSSQQSLFQGSNGATCFQSALRQSCWFSSACFHFYVCISGVIWEITELSNCQM